MPRKSGQLRRQYKGILNKPIVIAKREFPPSTILDGGETPEVKAVKARLKLEELMATVHHVECEYNKKLTALMRHHNIVAKKDGAWRALALELAKDHVPGFKIIQEKEGGRGTFWNEFALAKLYFDVSNMMAARNQNISGACDLLLREPPWCDIRSNGDVLTPKTLQNRYVEATKTSLVAVYHNILNDEDVSNNAPHFLMLINQMFLEMIADD